MTIRKYLNSDKNKVLAILKSNTPQYFDTSEELLFINYLENKKEDYFVIEDNHKVIGAGGINYFLDQQSARISWDLVDPNHQNKGVGKKLTKFRIERIKQNPSIKHIIVRTSQLAYGFYQKMGFQLETIEKDYWAKGFDLYVMKTSFKDDYQ